MHFKAPLKCTWLLSNGDSPLTPPLSKKNSRSSSTSWNGLSLLLPSSSKLLNLPRGDLWTLIEDSILQMNATTFESSKSRTPICDLFAFLCFWPYDFTASYRNEGGNEPYLEVNFGRLFSTIFTFLSCSNTLVSSVKLLQMVLIVKLQPTIYFDHSTGTEKSDITKETSIMFFWFS